MKTTKALLLRDQVAAALVGTLLLAWSRGASAQSTPAEDPPRRLHWNTAADEPSVTNAQAVPEARDVRSEIPIVLYTYTSYGTAAKATGAQGYGQGLMASGQSAIVGGGATVWASPIDRLTLIADAQRNVWGDFSPSLAGVVRLVGDPRDGWSFGALGKFKIDGFASGPRKDEIESEIELGALVSFTQAEWHLDMNAIGGKGMGDDGETDAEGRLRFGRNLGRLFRLSLDGQTRVRVGGPKHLPNGRIWDFAAGPQLLVGTSGFYGALSGGPTTMGLLSDSIGFATVITVGGTI